MILDNKNILNGKSKIVTVWDYLKKNTHGEQLSIVSGYFTIAALTLLKQFDQEPESFRLILSEMVRNEPQQERLIDILQGPSNLSNAFSLQATAQQAIHILKQNNVQLKRIDSAFCHAKTYIYDAEEQDNCFFIAGSSNFTEQGLGYTQQTGNIEFNVARKGYDGDDFKGALQWFNDIWKNIAKDHVDIMRGNVKIRISVKQYFIQCIEQFCKLYSPRDIYQKLLYELFINDINYDTNNEDKRTSALLEESAIWKTLYDFQKKGVRSLIDMLRKHNGAILADAVGLGKTFSALAVIKYFRSDGYFTLVLCPKKLKDNWMQYLAHQGSRFENDAFDYEVRFHTDLQHERLEYADRANLAYMRQQTKMLIVIDESHNLRNPKSARYNYLLQKLLQGRNNHDIKILQLSATPINNHLLDVLSQFRLIARGQDAGFLDTLDIPSLQTAFKDAQRVFDGWCQRQNRHIHDLKNQLPQEFLTLTDKLVLARTRKMVKKIQGNILKFPKQNAPISKFRQVSELGNLTTFDDIINALMASNMVAYQPYSYTTWAAKPTNAYKDQRKREFFLCKMMLILFLKRLESSWFACNITIQNVLKHHKLALQKVNAFIKGQSIKQLDTPNTEEVFAEDDFEELSLGKKTPVLLQDIIDIEQFKRDIEIDIQRLQFFADNMQMYADRFYSGKEIDRKLEDLRDILIEKVNKSHKRVIVFTSYSDTAKYLHKQLAKTFPDIAMVDGSTKMHETQLILQRFSPMSKLYAEKDWSQLYTKADPQKEHFKEGKWAFSHKEWKDLIEQFKDTDEEAKWAYDILQRPIRILIATDCLSEGQNLQDAQTIVNYDIHWNPTRLIQRQGRIDRIGSANRDIDTVNFWPAKDYESYLKLYGRVQYRLMAIATLGSEIPELNEELRSIADENPFLDENERKLLEQVAETGQGDNIQTFSFQDLSLEEFRQELIEFLSEKQEALQNMPNGIYSGFRTEDAAFNEIPNAIVALVREKESKKKHLILRAIDENNQTTLRTLNTQEILALLRSKLDNERFVPSAIDRGEHQEIEMLHDVMKRWMASMAAYAPTEAAKNALAGKILPTKNSEERVEDAFRPNNLELIAWEYISKQ